MQYIGLRSLISTVPAQAFTPSELIKQGFTGMLCEPYSSPTDYGTKLINPVREPRTAILFEIQRNPTVPIPL
jgi:hypothetical protein